MTTHTDAAVPITQADRDCLGDRYTLPHAAAFIRSGKSDNIARHELRAIATMRAERDAALARVAALEEAARPSADTKAEYSGEFKIALARSGYDEDGKYQEWTESVMVPWGTIKEIMKAISTHAASLMEKG